jgi:hypothetical protein
VGSPNRTVQQTGEIKGLDGYVEDEHGGFGRARPDEDVHSCINELASSYGSIFDGSYVIFPPRDAVARQ